jgi:hypothetical protein
MGICLLSQYYYFEIKGVNKIGQIAIEIPIKSH